jgi:hypothetical protein
MTDKDATADGIACDEGVDPSPGTLAATLALVYVDLDAHRRALHAIGRHSAVGGVEFSVQAPLFKGNRAIVDALAGAAGLSDKIDAYFRHGLLDEAERVRFARLFAARYAQRHPRVERQDLFVASGDVLGFTFELVSPMNLAVPREAFDAIAAGPHDSALLARLRAGSPPPRWHWRVRLRLFLDHALNPRRHDEPGVAAAARSLGVAAPFVVEVEASPALSGYARWALQPIVEEVGGRIAWLQA